LALVWYFYTLMHVKGCRLLIWIRYRIIDLKKLTSKHLIYDSGIVSHIF
jgi:hypothetical protein